VVVDTAIPKAWDGRLAYVVSQVGSPPVLAPAAMALTASVLSSSRAWTWAGIYVFLAVVTPLSYLIWLRHRGVVSDLDVQLREQRIRPLIFTIACAGLAWLALAGALWVQMATIFGITLRWKISVHCASAAGAAAVTCHLLGTPLLLLVGVPLVAWSRVRLRRHTVAQTVAGMALGLAIFQVALALMRGG
jgi:hypothetical protein